MGVQGLKFQLARHGQPEILTLRQGAAAGRKDSHLVIDGPSMIQLCTERAGIVSGLTLKDPDALLYAATSGFLKGLGRTGLKLVAFLDGADASKGAAVVAQAAADVGVELIYSSAGATNALILSWYLQKREQVFAVCSSDTDFFVYGVGRVAIPGEIVVDPHSVTFPLWGVDAAWTAWRVHREAHARGVSLLQRSQVAALLGREDPTAGPHAGAVQVSSPIIAAELSFSYEYELPLGFFQKDMGMRKFTEDDFNAFNAITATYVEVVESAGKAHLGALIGAAPAGAPSVDGAALALAAASLDDDAQVASGGLQVAVGSTLSGSDWKDIDNKDVVAKTKAGSSYKIMLEVQPYQPSIRGGAALIREGAVFDYMFSRRKEDGPWKKLCKACFPARYEEVSGDKEMKKEMDKVTAESVMAELKKAKAEGAPTIKWLETLARATPADLLELQRQALAAGCGSIQWNAAMASWSAASDRAKEEALEFMYTCYNTPRPFGKPMRYKHQEQIMDMVDKHLIAIEGAKGPGTAPLPLSVILSTPTGSGKTFTAIMMHLKLLADAHPDAILVYSVPTKMVLKRVGQECEAHNSVYWTAAAKDENTYQVRRPYSIRTKREKKAPGAKPEGAGSGSIKDQLDFAAAKGRELQDRGNGRPNIIVSDIFATMALLECARDESPSSDFHYSKIVLYLDEPNMGIHLDPEVRAVVSRIMKNAPMTTILASATLPPWDKLPSWWKGGGAPATRTTITQPPHSLPMSNLSVLDEERGTLSSVSPLQLFRGYEEFQALLGAHQQLRVLLLRHLSSRQGRDLLPECMLDPKDFMAVQGDVRTLRETLELELGRLPQPKFDALRAKWGGAAGGTKRCPRGVVDALSQTGVTMIATVDPRKVALELAGHGSGDAWLAEVHKVKNKRKEAARVAKDAEKAAARKKRDDEFDDGGDGRGQGVELRTGLLVTVEEAENADEDTLVMLSKGIAYATSDGTEDLVKRLYQEALLHVPESAVGQGKRLPPIHTLVVDYSSVYGTDCPAVDTIIMMEDLGKHLTWEDHQQFLGRLRRDGQAVYLSMRTLRRATIGLGEGSEQAEDLAFLRAVQAAALSAISEGGDPSSLGPEVSRLLDAASLPRAAAAEALLHTILALALPPGDHIAQEHRAMFPPAGKGAVKPEEVVKCVQRCRPLVALVKGTYAKGQAAEVKLLVALERLVAEEGPHEGLGARTYFAIVPQVLKLLYDLDAVSEDAIIAWRDAHKGEDGALSGPSVGGRTVVAQAAPFIKWLEEAEESSGEEESDDDEE